MFSALGDKVRYIKVRRGVMHKLLLQHLQRAAHIVQTEQKVQPHPSHWQNLLSMDLSVWCQCSSVPCECGWYSIHWIQSVKYPKTARLASVSRQEVCSLIFLDDFGEAKSGKKLEQGFCNSWRSNLSQRNGSRETGKQETHITKTDFQT